MLCNFIEERDCLDRGGFPRLEEVGQVLQRQAGVDNILDDDNVAVGDILVKVFDNPDDTG